MEVLQELQRFQSDRGLDKREFNLKSASLNIIEELLEAHGLAEDNERLVSNKVYNFIVSEIDKLKSGESYQEIMGTNIVDVGVKDIADAFCDIQVFAGGELPKLGYNNEKALNEVAKEINSREGEMLDDKFVKFKTPEAMAKWYKADFNNALNYNLEIDVDEVQVDALLRIGKLCFHHSIKTTSEIGREEAVNQIRIWKDLVISEQ